MATIIKRESVQEAPGGESVGRVAFDLQDLAGHADDYVELVRREAAKIVQEAHTEAKAIRVRAEQAGREAAEAEIQKLLDQRVAQQMSKIRPALDQLVAQLTDARGEWLDRWERSAVGLAAQMAERLVRRDLAQRPETTLEWVREALELVSGDSQITLRLNPTDHKNLGEQATAIADELGKLASTRVTPDAGVTPGGCVVETRHGTIDQQIESQLERLVQDLS